ncbi:uncharacterized protein [Rhodnius prolixus]|uniref:uncharacterized protein n=1 Tax=Rhodnius prolixus TaxID=13249 RepID=UPI003D18C325
MASKTTRLVLHILLGHKAFTLFFTLLIINSTQIKFVSTSEFPDRECCDPVYPLAAVSASIGPDTPTPPQHTTRQGEEKGSVETLNCLLARQLCFEDPSCSPILETIPRVCGPESGKEFFKIISIYYHRFT